MDLCYLHIAFQLLHIFYEFLCSKIRGGSKIVRHINCLHFSSPYYGNIVLKNELANQSHNENGAILFMGLRRFVLIPLLTL